MPPVRRFGEAQVSGVPLDKFFENLREARS